MPRSALLIDGQALLDADRLLRSGLGARRASFELSIRRMPAHTGYAVVAGVEQLIERVSTPLVDPTEIEHARHVAALSDELVDRLSDLAPTVDIDVVPDGTIAFANEPIATVEGPFFEAVIVGRLLRTFVQRSTAIATRTARLHVASGDDAIIDGSSSRASAEFSLEVARAAFVGGVAATTNPLASSALGIPFRAEARLDLGTLAPPMSSPQSGDGWGDAPSDRLIDLGAGDDEEAILLEAKRLGMRAGGWIARGLAEQLTLPSMRYELMAIEEGGAWAPRRGTNDAVDVIAGRKRVARYVDAAGRIVADVVHLHNERMQAPKSLGAVTLSPIVRAVLRGGRSLETPEPVTLARERAISARRSLAEGVAYLHRPTAYRVELSEGLRALRR